MFSARSGCERPAKTYALMVAGHPFHVEVADTPSQRERGLMYRTSMPKDHGMLFIFPSDQQLTFWMKNTNIPLAIAYISQDGVIKEIHHMVPHSLNPVQSDHSVRYGLEVNDGVFAALGIVPGDQVTLPSNLPTASQ